MLDLCNKRGILKHLATTFLGRKRFELTGTITLDGFLRICEALDRLPELERLLVPPTAVSMAELERTEKPLPKRGRR